jgi:hypothetical protein
MRPFWTQAELDELLPSLDARIATIESLSPNFRPLPPMTVEEALGRFAALFDIAGKRPLTDDERFLGEQLLSVFAMAVRAETLGKKGRYFCMSQEQVEMELRGDA